MIKPITGEDSFSSWLNTINEIIRLRTVDGNFRIENIDRDKRTLTISGGKARSNGEPISFPRVDLQLDFGVDQIIGCSFGKSSIVIVEKDSIPNNGFIPLYKVQTNNLSITLLEDLRTWAFDIDASDIPTREQIKELRDEMTRIMEAYESIPEVFSGDYNDLINKPTLFDGEYSSLNNKPVLFDGEYSSLNNKPDLFSGEYDDLNGKPELGSAASSNNEDFATAEQGIKADKAVEGVNVSKLVRISQEEYDALSDSEIDPQAIYIIK